MGGISGYNEVIHARSDIITKLPESLRGMSGAILPIAFTFYGLSCILNIYWFVIIPLPPPPRPSLFLTHTTTSLHARYLRYLHATLRCAGSISCPLVWSKSRGSSSARRRLRRRRRRKRCNCSILTLEWEPSLVTYSE